MGCHVAFLVAVLNETSTNNTAFIERIAPLLVQPVSARKI